MTATSKIYTSKSNATRAAKAQGIDPATVTATEGGFTFPVAPATDEPVALAPAMESARAEIQTMVGNPEGPATEPAVPVDPVAPKAALPGLAAILEGAMNPKAPKAMADLEAAQTALKAARAKVAEEAKAAKAAREAAAEEAKAAREKAAEEAKEAKAAREAAAEEERVANAAALAEANEAIAKAEASLKALRESAKALKPAKAPRAPKAPGEPKAPRDTKRAAFVAMLRRPEGCTLTQAMEAFGWQRHTCRGAIAGGIKVGLGLTVEAEKVDNEMVYRIVD